MVDSGPVAFSQKYLQPGDAVQAIENPLVNEKQTKNKTNMSDTSKAVTIKEILDTDKYDDQQIVKCVSGTIIGIFDPTKGTGANGEWEYQNGTLKDATGQIKVSFSKCSQPKSAKGKKITMSSFKTEKHGWQGVKVADSSYEKDGKTVNERVLKITPTATIEYEGGAPSESSSSTGGSGKPGQSQPQTVSKYEHDLSIHPALIVGNILSLHLAVHKQVTAEYPIKKGEVSEETQRAYVSSVFIESVKQGAGIDYVRRQAKPAPPLAGYPPPPEDPSEWKTCIMPKGNYEGKTIADIPDDKLLEYYNKYQEAKSQSALAKCIYQAAEDRKILPQDEPEEQSGEPDID